MWSTLGRDKISTVKLLHTITVQFSLKETVAPVFFVSLLACINKLQDWNRYIYWILNFSVAPLILQLFLVYEGFQTQILARGFVESSRWIYKFKKFVIGPYFSQRTTNKWEKIYRICKHVFNNIDELYVRFNSKKNLNLASSSLGRKSENSKNCCPHV